MIGLAGIRGRTVEDLCDLFGSIIKNHVEIAANEYRFQSKDPVTKQPEQLDGFFHLIENDGWKVDDLFITAQNHQTFDEPLSLARNYRLFLTGDGWSASRRSSGNSNSSLLDPKLTRPYMWGLGKFLGTAGKGLVIAIVAGTAAWVASLRNRTTASPDKS